MNLNSVDISGNLTRDPEIRYTKGGTAVLTFSVAINERRKNAQTGEWEDHPVFVDCVRFGESCEYWNERLRKGTHVSVHGRLRLSQWEKDGQKRSKLDVIAEDIDAYVSANGQQTQRRAQQPTYSAPPQPPAEVYDEDIPF